MHAQSSELHGRAAWLLILAASVVMMITTGTRLSMGLFISPMNTSTGLGVVAISFAMAVAQFVWGLAQPVFGAVADRYGPGRVIVTGGLMLAAGTALTPFVDTQWGLIFAMGLLSAAGAGAGSFSTLMGATAQRLSPRMRAHASGVVNAGGSAGQLLFAQLAQGIIGAAGWVAAMLTMAAAALLTLPLAWPLRRRAAPAVTPATAAPAPSATAASDATSASASTSLQAGASAPGSAATAGAPVVETGLWTQVRASFSDRSYLCLHAGFFTCGFHIAFLVTHMPGEVELCGLPLNVSANVLALIGLFNIAGSLAAGSLSTRYRMKHLLAIMYASRAVFILAYLAAPKTPETMYLFAAGLGLTWLATVPPTAGLVGKLFGTRYLSTLFGLTLVSHQTGAFFGAWLGGLAVASSGNYQWMWYADV
ncbi:MAG: hypothetical protein RJA99_3383, partial [Pseudomonadota bacterium]